MSNDDHTMVPFTRDSLRRLRKAHKQAKESKNTSFYFDGNEYLTAYAGYVIEYLEIEFKLVDQTKKN